MTSKNSLLNKPFLLKPVGKNYLWGGDRLNYDFSKNIDMNGIAQYVNGKSVGVLAKFPE